VVQRIRFFTLAFDRPETVFDLPQWRWPLIGSYNGFSGAARIRGWQLIRFYQANGWLTYNDVCSVTGLAGGTQLHNEDYTRPYDAYPVSNRAHTLIHTRARFPKAWAEFLANDACPKHGLRLCLPMPALRSLAAIARPSICSHGSLCPATNSNPADRHR
jgi:hypothetical protein